MYVIFCGNSLPSTSNLLKLIGHQLFNVLRKPLYYVKYTKMCTKACSNGCENPIFMCTVLSLIHWRRDELSAILRTAFQMRFAELESLNFDTNLTEVSSLEAKMTICRHDDVIKWKHFSRYWPVVRGIHRSPVHSPTKASDAELWWFLQVALK